MRAPADGTYREECCKVWAVVLPVGSRRVSSGAWLWLALGVFAALPPAPGLADGIAPIAASFAGERLTYDVSVLVFRRAAVSRLALEPAGGGAEPGGAYRASLAIETSGFIGRLQKRRHTYESTLVPCEGGRRWCPHRFTAELSEPAYREVTTTYLNPARGLLTWTIERNGTVEEIGWKPMQSGLAYEDLLSGFYNFRAGVYGPVEPGRRYVIRTVPIKGVTEFTLRVLREEEAREARRKHHFGTGGVVVAIRVPEPVFEREGEVIAWFSSDLVPLAGVVENYIGFGDVAGWLVDAVLPLPPPFASAAAGGPAAAAAGP